MRKTYKERLEAVRQDILAEMRELRAKGWTMSRIGEEYGISRAAVNNFMKGHCRRGE